MTDTKFSKQEKNVLFNSSKQKFDSKELKGGQKIAHKKYQSIRFKIAVRTFRWFPQPIQLPGMGALGNC